MRALLLAAALGLLAAAPARCIEAADIGRAEIVADLPKGGAIEGEMIRLHLRATRRGRITLEELRQPALTDLSWTQLGRDTVFEAQAQGFIVPGVQRDLAVFAQRAGPLVIEPFIVHMTVLDENSERVELDMASAPLRIEVQPVPAEAKGKPWLPAAELTLTDTWDKPVNALTQGEVAHRTLRIEALGLTADRLPPAPLLRAPGVIAFAYPAERVTEITPQGPAARALYQWDVKPVSQDAAELPPVEINWFDTRERRMKVASVRAVKVKLLAAGAMARAAAAQAGALSPPALLALCLVACLWGLAGLALWRGARGQKQQAALRPF